MKIVGPDFIDYWQPTTGTAQAAQSRFGIRLRQGRCWPLVQVGDESPSSFGSAQEIPVEVSSLPGYMLIVVKEDLARDPASDLVELLLGKKSIQQARKAAGKSEKTESPQTKVRLPNKE